MQEFNEYTQPSHEFFEDLWREAMIVLDSNALLNLYRYPRLARIDLQTILEATASRLFVPHQAALEFFRNRPIEMARQTNQFETVRNLVEKLKNQFARDLDMENLEQRHSLIDPSSLKKILGDACSEMSETISELKDQSLSFSGEDDVLDWLNEFVFANVGPAPADQAALDEVYRSGKERFAARIPPGFCDKKKEKSKDSWYHHKGMRYQRAYGDLLVWEQTIDQATQARAASVIFVTDDGKEDWWWCSSGKTVAPLPSLRSEIEERTGGTAFWMYNVPRFLERGRNYLGVKVSDSSIAQAQDISAAAGGYIEGIAPETIVYSALERFAPTLPTICPVMRSEIDKSPDSILYMSCDRCDASYDQESDTVFFSATLGFESQSTGDGSWPDQQFEVELSGVISRAEGAWKVRDFYVSECKRVEPESPPD